MEKLTEVELTNISVEEIKTRNICNNATSILIQEDDIETPYGNFHVAIQGDRAKTAIITFHDIGMNHNTCFQGFFNYSDMQPILRHFCVYHVNAPGQEEGALHLRPEFVYPTMDQLAAAIHHIVENYRIKRFIGFGVGAGANVLCRYSLMHPEFVDSMVLINATAATAGWVEWGYQKMNSWYLWRGNMSAFTEDYLLWHWFGRKTQWENYDLVAVYKDYIKTINTQNLSLFIESYLKRADLGIERELDPIRKASVKRIKTRTLLMCGDDSPHMDEVVEMNGRMDPEETELLKIQDCGGMPLEEQPAKVCEAFRLFLQGMGYIPNVHQAHRSATKPLPQLVQHRNDMASYTPVC